MGAAASMDLAALGARASEAPWLLLACVTACMCLGCDQGTPTLEDAVGPPLQVVATYPRAGEGVDCVASADPNCGVPTNAPLELRFDRHLLHSTAVRQSLTLYSGDAQSPVFVRPQYDVVERVLRLYPSAALQPNTLYTVVLPKPTASAPLGFRAFDGAPLGEGPVPLRFGFYTSAQTIGPEPTCEPTCDAVVRSFQASGCGRLGCHNAEPEPEPCDDRRALDPNQDCVSVPRMGLHLASVAGLRQTAISRVAHQAETGPQGGVPLVNPARMGVQMPLIDPGRPGNSYLLFKTLLRPANFAQLPEEQLTPDGRARRAACTPVYRSALPEGQTQAPSEEERARLRNWFVRGEGMPLVARDGDPDRSPLTLDALHEIQRWIALGAPCP